MNKLKLLFQWLTWCSNKHVNAAKMLFVFLTGAAFRKELFDIAGVCGGLLF